MSNKIEIHIYWIVSHGLGLEVIQHYEWSSNYKTCSKAH